MKEFKAALSYSLEQSLTRVELAKEQIKKKKINSPSRLEEPSLSCNLWCQRTAESDEIREIKYLTQEHENM